MKTFKQIISEVKQSVKDWQAGVRSSQLAGIPSSEQFKNPDFQAGWKTGLEKGSRALDPSYRAKRVNNQSKAIAEEKGEKDACYFKVKSRYKKWPSAYASGSLVQCREVGAENWGNKKD